MTSSIPTRLKSPDKLSLSLHLLLLFGGSGIQIAWSLVAIFTISFIRIEGPRECIVIPAYLGKLATVPGTIVRTIQDECKTGPRTGIPIYRYIYVFTPAGRDAGVFGYSFTEGIKFTSGQQVTIEYRPQDPTISRIHGTRATPFPGLSLFLASLVVLILYFTVRGYKRRCRLISHGVVCIGSVSSVISPKPPGSVHKVTIRFDTAYNRRHEFTFDEEQMYSAYRLPTVSASSINASAKAHDKLATALNDPFWAQLPPGYLGVVYDPDDPQNTRLLQHLNDFITVSSNGTLTVISAWKTLQSCIIPVLGLLLIMLAWRYVINYYAL